MIQTVPAPAEKETMEAAAQNEEKSSYSKRSNVVELWKKREGTIKAANIASSERARGNECEEKKETSQWVDFDSIQDSRQQEKSSTSQGGSERNGPESFSDAFFDWDTENMNNDFTAPRRSSVRDSWKKKAATIPSPQPSPRVGVTRDTISLQCETGDPEPESAPESKEIPPTTSGVVRSPSTVVRSSSFKSPVVRSSSFANNRIAGSPQASGSSAFDELKSKWAKFGVRKQNEQGNGSSQSTQRLSELPSKVIVSPSEPSQNDVGTKEIPQIDNEQQKKISGHGSQSSNGENVGAANTKTAKPEIKETEPLMPPQASNDLKKSLSPSSSAARRLGSKSFRSKYGRRPIPSLNRATEKAAHDTKSPTTKEDPGQKISSPPVQKISPDCSKPSIENPSFPLDESTQNEHNMSPSSNLSKSLGPNLYGRSRSFDPRSKHVSAQSTMYTSGSADDSTVIKEGSATVSRSALSSRASRRLRDIRQSQRQQMQKKDANENASKETLSKSPISTDKSGLTRAETNPLLESQIEEPGRIRSRTSSSIQKSRTQESHGGNTFISVEESTTLSPSFCSEGTFGNSQMRFNHATELNSGNETSLDSKLGPTSPLHNVVPDMNDMIPDEFVSEKNANFESFKTAYDNTSLSQIARDMTEEASKIFELDIHAAINNLGDMFQSQSPRKMAGRAPSPVEEVAIEVEYVADD